MISRDSVACYMQDGYELYYKTQRQNSTKYIHFDTLEECFTWCKRNYKNITPVSGSWTALDYVACFKTNGKPVAVTA